MSEVSHGHARTHNPHQHGSITPKTPPFCPCRCLSVRLDPVSQETGYLWLSLHTELKVLCLHMYVWYVTTQRELSAFSATTQRDCPPNLPPSPEPWCSSFYVPARGLTQPCGIHLIPMFCLHVHHSGRHGRQAWPSNTWDGHVPFLFQPASSLW